MPLTRRFAVLYYGGEYIPMHWQQSALLCGMWAEVTVDWFWTEHAWASCVTVLLLLHSEKIHHEKNMSRVVKTHTWMQPKSRESSQASWVLPCSTKPNAHPKNQVNVYCWKPPRCWDYFYHRTIKKTLKHFSTTAHTRKCLKEVTINPKANQI